MDRFCEKFDFTDLIKISFWYNLSIIPCLKKFPSFFSNQNANQNSLQLISARREVLFLSIFSRLHYNQLDIYINKNCN